MRVKISYDWIILVVLFSFKILLFFGVPTVFIYSLILTLLSYWVYLNKKISKESSIYVFGLFLISMIDKFNDFSTNGNLGLFIIPFSFLLITSFFFNTKLDVRKALPRIVLINILILFLLNLKTPFAAYDRDITTLIVFYSILSYKRFNSKVLILIAFLITFLLFESRTSIFSFIAFLAIVTIKKNYPIVKKSIILFTVIISTAIISTVIYYETSVTKGVSVEFTGRGIIWERAISNTLGSNIKNILLGSPSNPKDLEEIFGTIRIQGKKNQSEHMRDILLAGNFHNGIVYIIFNTGVIGLTLFSILAIKFLNNTKNTFEIALFISIYIIYFFNGRGITSLYIDSIILIYILSRTRSNANITHQVRT